MNGNRSKGTWVWVTMVAISFASLARVQSGVDNARAYADPVIKFFAVGSQTESDASVRSDHASSRLRAGSYGIDLNLLAVFFVGLVAPLALEQAPGGLCLKRTPAAPLHPALFQRPPPFSLV